MNKKKSDLLVCGYQSRADDLKYGQEEVRPFDQWVPEQSRQLKNMDKKKSDLLVCGCQSRADDLKIWTRRGQTFWSVGARAEMT